MPTSTFFRLPKEKQTRLLAAAWEEFSRVSYPSVSINRIILKAHIPRGSFYQYFSDKEDLFLYLCGDLRQYLFQAVEGALKRSSGDLFAAMLTLYDNFNQSTSCPELPLKRCMQLCRLNPDLNLRQTFQALPGLLQTPLWPLVDASHFRRKDPTFVCRVFLLLGMATIAAIISTLSAPEQREEHRQTLLAQLDIIQNGCLADQAAQTQIGGMES